MTTKQRLYAECGGDWHRSLCWSVRRSNCVPKPRRKPWSPLTITISAAWSLARTDRKPASG